MKLYNTLTASKDVFEPILPHTVTIYSCGPTVYNYAHIGNLRSYIFMDLLRRTLKQNGYRLLHVMNVTDVGHLVSDSDEGEDKMLKGAREQNKSPWEIARHYEEAFVRDTKLLNIEETEYMPRATDHICDMITFVEALLAKGFAYEISDGIYFDISKFEEYGKLSGVCIDDLQAGARVDVHPEKRHPADFALWKKAPKEHIMQWESPWGMGYPGWHIECSAMSRKYLGDVFDIHTGGVDHIPVHHENEIAQSKGLTQKNPARFWLHGEFILVNNGKMSKSIGNTYTLHDLNEKGIPPLAYRYFCLNAHYRNKLNFTWEAIQAAKVSLIRFYKEVLRHKNGTETVSLQEVEGNWQAFLQAIYDDLNIPKALGIAWNVLRTSKSSKAIYELVCKMDSVFGLDVQNAKLHQDMHAKEGHVHEFPPEIAALLEKRKKAREQKDYALSDQIRDELQIKGYLVKDTKEGMVLTKNSE